MTDMVKILKEILEKQIDDSRLWFGDDIEYVRDELRKLHEVLENKSWIQCAKESLEELQKDIKDGSN